MGASTLTCGASHSSSLVMVPCPEPSAITALLGELSVTTNVSLPSQSRSPWIVTLTGAVRLLGGKFAVPEALS